MATSSPLNEALRSYSPGTMHLSELDTSTRSTSIVPPRKLKPISPRRKKKRPGQVLLTPPPSSSSPPISDAPPITRPLMNQSMLSQLRARMDLEYDPNVHSGSTSPNKTPPPMTTPLPFDELTSDGNTEENKPRRKKKRKKKLEMSDTPTASPQKWEGGGRSEGGGGGGGEEGRVSERGLGMDVDEDPLSKMRESPNEEENSAGVGSGRHGRQLPDFPTDPDAPEDSLLQSVATHPPETTPLNPDGPLQLISKDDIIEEVEDKGDLPSLHYTLPSSQPKPFTSQSNDLIYLERKDGKGFLRRKKGDAESLGDDFKEDSLNLGTNGEITSVDIALYIQMILQKLALMAHGLIAGISMWEAIVANVLSRQPIGHINILEHYHTFTLPSHALHFLFLSLVFLSLLDKFDLARVSKSCLHNLIRTPSQIILFLAWVLVFVALVISLSLASIDSRLTVLHVQPLLWSDILSTINLTYQFPSQFSIAIPSPTNTTIVYVPSLENTTSSRISVFLALLIARATCCVLSWMGVVWITNYNRLEDYLTQPNPTPKNK